MKNILVFLAAAGMLSAVQAARPVVLSQKTSFSFTPKQFLALPDAAKASPLIHVSISNEFPIAIDGVPSEKLDALRRMMYDGATLRAEGLEGPECSPSQYSNLLKRIGEKLNANASEGVAAGALEYFQKITFPMANSRYAVMDHVGYDNEGGNGCHTFGFTRIVRLEDMKPLEYGDFVRDRSKMGDLLVEALNRAYLTEDADGKPVPYLSSEKGASWSTAAVYKGEPEMRPKAEGMEFYFSAYEILPGCCGLPTVQIPWSKLWNVCDSKLVTDLKSLANE